MLPWHFLPLLEALNFLDLFETLGIFCGTFPDHSAFWKQFTLYFSDFFRALNNWTTIEGRHSTRAEADVQKPLVFRVLLSSIFLGQVAQEPLMTGPHQGCEHCIHCISCLITSYINTSMFHATLSQTTDAHAGKGTAMDSNADAPQPPSLVRDWRRPRRSCLRFSYGMMFLCI